VIKPPPSPNQKKKNLLQKTSFEKKLLAVLGLSSAFSVAA
jgi:hypothetical protein